MQRKIVKLVMVVFLLFLAATAGAAELTSVDAAQFKSWLSNKKPMILADIQRRNDFKQHHFYGAIETNAYPAKTQAEKGRLDVILRMFQKTGMDVIIVGPRGGASTRRAAEYLLEQGIPTDKMFILDGGVKNWPDQEMLLDVAGGCS